MNLKSLPALFLSVLFAFGCSSVQSPDKSLTRQEKAEVAVIESKTASGDLSQTQAAIEKESVTNKIRF